MEQSIYSGRALKLFLRQLFYSCVTMNGSFIYSLANSWPEMSTRIDTRIQHSHCNKGCRCSGVVVSWHLHANASTNPTRYLLFSDLSEGSHDLSSIIRGCMDSVWISVPLQFVVIVRPLCYNKLQNLCVHVWKQRSGLEIYGSKLVVIKEVKKPTFFLSHEREVCRFSRLWIFSNVFLMVAQAKCHLVLLYWWEDRHL